METIIFEEFRHVVEGALVDHARDEADDRYHVCEGFFQTRQLEANNH